MMAAQHTRGKHNKEARRPINGLGHSIFVPARANRVKRKSHIANEETA